MIVAGNLKLIEQSGGKLKLWFVPGLEDKPPQAQYVVAADIATGSDSATSSNSVLSGANVATGEQVLEYVDAGIAPQRFAQLCCAIGEWLNRAFLMWEANGPTGGLFAKTVMTELFYPNVYKEERARQTAGSKSGAGWNNNQQQSKDDLFAAFWVGMDDGEYTPRSADMIKECRGWEWEKKKIIYKGEAHGDRAIAGGLCWKGMLQMQSFGIDKKKPTVQTTLRSDTMAGRLEMRRERQLAAQEDGMFGHRQLSAARKYAGFDDDE